jgi:hypothetical protein
MENNMHHVVLLSRGTYYRHCNNNSAYLPLQFIGVFYNSYLQLLANTHNDTTERASLTNTGARALYIYTYTSVCASVRIYDK